MNVLFITPKNPQSATSRYRCHHIAEALRLAQPGARVSVHAITDARIELTSPDVVVLHRLRFGGEADRVLAAARQVGAVTVASVDDLIFSPEYAYQVGLTAPPDDPTFYRYHRAEADDHLRTLAACDVVVASTEFLAAEVRLAVPGTPVTVLRNFLSARMAALADVAHAARTRRLALGGNAVTLAYLSGSPTHDLDFAGIAPVLAGVLARHDEARLLLVGAVALPPALAGAADAGRVLRHPFVAWQDLFGLTALADITLAPLDASRLFNHAKSEIKRLEAGAVGVPTVATATAGVCETGGGVCCRNDAEWRDTLERLITGEGRVAGEAARSEIRATGTADTHAGAVAEAFAAWAAMKATSGGTATRARVMRPWRERAVEWLRNGEAAWVARRLRFRRHNRLLEADLLKRGL